MFARIAALLFPPKCVLCGKLLKKDETDLCRRCRTEVPHITASKRKLSYVAGWTAIWYYKDIVRKSLHRFKFRGKRSYAGAYGRMLAMQLSRMPSFDILTWVPVSAKRRRQRGYDQVELICAAVGEELEMDPIRTLEKIRHTPPQSSLSGKTRQANVLGAYKALCPEAFSDKRVLLLDDIITTGATASECAKMLRAAGAKEVFFAAVAAVSDNNTQ